MGRARANGIEIEYETLGTKADPTILLIMGLGGQLIHWPDAFCTGLVERGFHVVRFTIATAVSPPASHRGASPTSSRS